MLRSLLSIMLIAGLGVGASSATQPVTFDPIDLLTVDPVPVKKKTATAPVVGSKSALLMDMSTGIILHQKNAHARLPMASLTKIMTAVIILEHHSLSEVVTVNEDFDQYGELGVRVWLKQYEKITVGNLLIGMLVPSGGDAAIALAEHHSGSVRAFVDEMNQKAKALHLRDTHFTNPIGLDSAEHYSSAFDLAVLTKYALRDPNFRRIVRMPRATISSTDGEITHVFEGTNYLLNSYLDIRGVKTGTTDAAGESLINLARRADGKEVIVVLLNSPERFQESKRLLEWSFNNFLW